ncbi:DUF938 domain-containing protein [Qipengyuania sp. ASV99]
MAQVKQHAPATLRNREAIAEVLERELPESGLVLEVASGTGEHAVFLAERFAALEWQPSDPDPKALGSILAYREEFERYNLRLPLVIDASAPESWEVNSADAILCINMVHISPWQATEGLFKGAAQVLGKVNAPLVLYGPYLEADVETAPSNTAFDQSLKSRDGRWGLRKVNDLDRVARANGFTRTARHGMPANNLTLVYRRA